MDVPSDDTRDLPGAPRVEVRYRPACLIGPALGSLILTGVGLWVMYLALKHLAPGPDRPWAIGIGIYGFIGLFLPGVVAAVWFWRLATRPALILDERGLLDQSSVLRSSLFLKWQDVNRVILTRPQFLWKKSQTTSLLVVPRDPDITIRQLNPLARFRLRLAWKLIKIRWVTCVPDGVNIPLEELGQRLADMAGVELEVLSL